MCSHVERRIVSCKCIHNMLRILITKDNINTYIKQEGECGLDSTGLGY